MLLNGEIITDNFAGGGGASQGIWEATGRHPDVAVNHWREALGIHAINHDETEHFVSDVWEIDPVEACGAKPVGLAWFSPDCTHFSKAKGAAPKSKKIRALAWVVVRWARQVRPRVIVVENVEEFLTWGPLDADGQPVKTKAGQEFRRWWGRMTKGLRYRGAYRQLCAADYGVPTLRTRLFLVFRCDGIDPVFPAPTHGSPAARAKHPALLPWVPVRDLLDYDLPCHSIFMTPEEVREAGLKIRRPLAEPTLARIARSFTRHVAKNPDPFIRERQAPLLIQTGYGERKATARHKAQDTRVLDIQKPLGSIVACGIKHAVASFFLVKNENSGQGVDQPAAAITSRDSNSTDHPTDRPALAVTAKGNHLGTVYTRLVREDELTAADAAGAVRCFHFLTKYNGTQQYPQIDGPSPAILATENLSLVQVVCVRLADGDYIVADIGMRMLTPRELARCQGFPDSYDIGEGTISKEDQVGLIGNSVCPGLARAIVEANLGIWRGELLSHAKPGPMLDATITYEPESN